MRRLGMVLGVLAALLAAAPVSADTIAPPSGSFVSVQSEPTCDGTLCTTVLADFGAFTGNDAYACLYLVTTDSEAGNAVVEEEQGCGDPDTVIGHFTIDGGFIVGIADTTLTVESTFGGERDVTFSATLEGTADVLRYLTDGFFGDYPEAGCDTTYSAKVKRLFVAGDVIVGGDTFAGTGYSDVVQAKFKTRC